MTEFVVWIFVLWFSSSSGFVGGRPTQEQCRAFQAAILAQVGHRVLAAIECFEVRGVADPPGPPGRE